MHLVSARDCLDWRPLFHPLHAAQFSGRFRHGTQGVNRDALLRQAKRLLEEQPRTRAELGKLLAERWPDADPVPLPPGNGATAGGMWQGTWQIQDRSLGIRLFTKLCREDCDALLAEAARSCAFLAPSDARHGPRRTVDR
ncbi:crosslink repair DNA glycosylase YcaQ family protein [Actinoallomurus sp. NPDC052308]|uniref:DNA glycosylase AlkZ-like family protein n=1 Tax=Actinoallomurus sp. NPDC052308 TaxID=3155530 RepID=UPI0034232F41